MKKTISIIIAVVFISCIASTFTSAAVSTGENVAVKATESTPITIDGVKSPGEWDGATQFTVNKDTTGSTETTNLSVVYNLKWDATYLYICEVRTDTDPLIYLVTGADLLEGKFYQGNSTLFFMWFDNGVSPAEPNLDYIDLQYAAKSPSGNPVYGKRLHESDQRALYTNGAIASVVGANTSTIELKFKWSDLPNAAGNITGGTKIQFYVCDTKTKPAATLADISDWNGQAYQIVWGKGLGIDATDWNTMTLQAAAGATPTPSLTLAPTATTAAVPTTAVNPTTGSASNNGIVLLLAVSSLVTLMLIYKRKNKSAEEN